MRQRIPLHITGFCLGRTEMLGMKLTAKFELICFD